MEISFTEIILPAGIGFLSTLLALGVSVLSWQRRAARGALPMCFMMIATAIWSCTFAVQLLQTDLGLKMILDQVQYLGLATISPLFMIFAFDFAGFSQWTRWNHLVPVFAIPTITILLAFTNSWHGLIWRSYLLEPGDPHVSMEQGGPGFWFLLVGYSYLCFCVGIFQLVRAYFRFPLQYRSHVKIVLVAVLLPFLSDFLFLMDLLPVKNMEPTSPILAISGALITWGILRANLLNLVPVAREAVIERMPDGLIVLDQHLCIMDVNPSARKLIGSATQVGQPLAVLTSPWSNLTTPLGSKKSGNMPIQLGKGADSIWIDVIFTPMLDEHGGVGSWFLLLHDITESHRMLQELRSTNRQLYSLATRDSLTRLYSRRFLEESLERELSRARRDSTSFALIHINLDRFKKFNEDFGAIAGDSYLRSFAEMLLAHSSGDELVCRYGGDEFVVALPGVSLDAALARAQNWQLLKPAASTPACSFSAGVSVFPEHVRTWQALLRAAKNAGSQAKSAGRGRIEVAVAAPVTSVLDYSH